jgi:hypothetical protein
LIKDLISDLIPNGFAILQHVDDTILCMEEDADTTQNMKTLLYLYEKMSGLKINFNKSEIIMVSSDEQKALCYSEIFNCATGVWPVKYLGVPISTTCC